MILSTPSPAKNTSAQTVRSGTASAATPAVIWLLAGGVLVMHVAFAQRYGFFRDELYYLACSEHLDWGYVDQPPLIALIAWLVRHALGGSLLSIRLLPALA